MQPVLFVLLLASSLLVASAADEVIFTQLVHRHGSRSPIVTVNASIICTGGFGCGELNLEGRDMLTQLGALIRNRYPTVYTDPNYGWDTVYSRSTSKNRTIQSSASMLHGLFPNASDYYPIIFSEALENDMLLLSDNYASVNLQLPFLGLYDAPVVTAKREEVFPDPAVINAIFKELHIEGYAAALGINYGLILAQDIATCYMATGEILNGNYPVTNASQAQLDSVLFALNSNRFVYNRSVDHWAKSGSPGITLALKLVENMRNVISGAEQHFMIEYSAHDTTLVPLCSTLGASDEMTPVFGKMFLFEMVNRSGSYFVRAIGGAPEQTPGAHHYTTYTLPLRGIPVNGTYQDAYVVTADTGVAIDDFYRYIVSSMGTSGQGMCYIGDAAFARIGCNVLGAPTPGSDCFKYRYECRDFACPDGSYLSNSTTLECSTFPAPPASPNTGPTRGEMAGISVGSAFIGIVLGSVLMFVVNKGIQGKDYYKRIN